LFILGFPALEHILTFARASAPVSTLLNGIAKRGKTFISFHKTPFIRAISSWVRLSGRGVNEVILIRKTPFFSAQIPIDLFRCDYHSTRSWKLDLARALEIVRAGKPEKPSATVDAPAGERHWCSM
jgi:hypothetical protein